MASDRRRGAHQREHIDWLGDYLPEPQRPVPPLDPTIDFAFKSEAETEMHGFFSNSGGTSLHGIFAGIDSNIDRRDSLFE